MCVAYVEINRRPFLLVLHEDFPSRVVANDPGIDETAQIKGF
jgi:hypothetical protein